MQHPDISTNVPLSSGGTLSQDNGFILCQNIFSFLETDISILTQKHTNIYDLKSYKTRQAMYV
jgi:hypothetical protein